MFELSQEASFLDSQVILIHHAVFCFQALLRREDSDEDSRFYYFRCFLRWRGFIIRNLAGPLSGTYRRRMVSYTVAISNLVRIYRRPCRNNSGRARSG